MSLSSWSDFYGNGNVTQLAISSGHYVPYQAMTISFVGGPSSTLKGRLAHTLRTRVEPLQPFVRLDRSALVRHNRISE